MNGENDQIHLRAMSEGNLLKTFTIKEFSKKAIELQFNSKLKIVLGMMLRNFKGDKTKQLNEFYVSLFKMDSPVGIDLIEYLIDEVGVDVNYRDSSGSSCLHQYYWRKHGDVKMLGLLIKKGIDVNGKDNTGNTILHKLLMRRSKNELEITKFLLDNGASINQKNSWGNSPFFVFSSRNNTKNELYDLLIKYGADPKEKESNGENFESMSLKKQTRFRNGFLQTMEQKLNLIEKFLDDFSIKENEDFRNIKEIESKMEYLCKNDLIYH